MPFMCACFFFTPRTRFYPAVAAVVADAVNRGIVVDHRCVVNVVDVRDVYVGHRAVVVKPFALPSSAFLTATEVTVAIADPAIETYMRTPVAVVENKAPATPTPVACSPQHTEFRRYHPLARH